ncbi:hypothetical protein D3C71_699180 [compost metagenome]
MGGGEGGQLGLAALGAFPQLVVDNAQVWRGLADPVLGWVQDGRPFPGIGVFAIAAAVEHAHADIEFLVQDAVLGAAVAVDGRRCPCPAAGPGFACGVQAVGDGAGRFTPGVTFEDRVDYAGLVLVDRQHALGSQVVPVAAASAGEAVLDAGDEAAAGLVAKFGQEHLVHRAFEADVKLGHVSF